MGERVAALLLVLSAAALADPASASQDRVRFDRRAHLPGFEEVLFSDFVDLYDLERFEEAEGRLVGEERLAQLRRAWKAERERVAALLEAERSDPDRWATFLRDRALARHAFFSEVDLVRIDDVDGFVVYVQAPKKEDPGYAERVARWHTSRLLPLRKHFVEAYAVPGGFERNPEFGPDALIVLASYADLATYAKLASPTPHYRTHAVYDVNLRAGIVTETPFERTVTPEERANAARHAYAHVLLHAHHREKRKPLQEDWLHEGLATYLADLRKDPAGRLVAPDPPVETLRRLVAATQRRDTVLRHFHTIAGLYSIPSLQHLFARAEMHARREGRSIRSLDARGLQLCYWREALLLVDFLQREGRREGFLRLLADELAGRGGHASFARCFPRTGPLDVDRAFLEHLFDEHERRLPDVPVSRSAIRAVLEGDASLAPLPGEEEAGRVADRGAPAPGGAGPAEPAEPAFEPAHLRPRGLAPRATLALCLDLARRGRSELAVERLDATLAGALDADVRARLERARERLAAWNRLRVAWFEHLAGSGERLRFRHDGRWVRAGVERVADGCVYLKENRGDVASLELEELAADALAREMGADAEALPDGWARAVARVLDGGRRVILTLDEDDPRQAALARDLEDDLPELLERGVPLGELDELGRTPIPRDPARCEELIARLARVVERHGDLPEVEALRPRIRDYARLALEVVFEVEGAPQLVSGEWEALDGDRVRIAYDFDDPEQLADFRRDDEFMADRRRGLGELRGDRTAVAVEDGALVGIGRAALRHRLGLSPPVTARWQVEYGDPDGPSTNIWILMVGVGARGEHEYAASLGRIDLEVARDGSVSAAYADDRMPLYTDSTYSLELELDGEGPDATARMRLGGEEMQSLPAAGVGGSGIFLVFHSDWVVRLKSLAIEGELDEAATASARAAWIEEQLEERGL